MMEEYKKIGGRVCHLRFEEGAGRVTYDNTFYENNGTLKDGCTWTTDGIGRGIKFNGTNSYVEISDDASLDIADELTVEAWVKIDAWTGRYQAFVSKAYAETWAMVVKDQKYFRWHITTGGTLHTVNSTIYPQLGKWYHLAMTYSSSSGIFRGYVNGELDVERVLGGAIAVNDRHLMIGSDLPAMCYPANGLVDEVKIYRGVPCSE